MKHNKHTQTQTLQEVAAEHEHRVWALAQQSHIVLVADDGGWWVYDHGPANVFPWSLDKVEHYIVVKHHNYTL